MASKARRLSATRSIQSSRLGAIDEDGGMHPDGDLEQSANPLGENNRNISRLLPFDVSPRAQHERAPPPYSEWDGMKGPGESLAGVRDGRKHPKRGRGRRILVILVASLAIIAGFVVGLVIGLRKGHKSNDSQAPPAADNQTESFPGGTYSLTTFLNTVKTDCTPNAATWQCYPYSTINQSTTASMATFNWVIRQKSPGSSTYLISSTDNPFAITFTNATLSLTNWGLDDEAYTFGISLDKTVIPTVALTSDGALAQCMYNATSFTAFLYTKMANTYPSSKSSSSSTSFQPWPYAVSVTQAISGGAGVPDCYKLNNGKLGDRISLQTETSAQTCSCNWQNYGT